MQRISKHDIIGAMSSTACRAWFRGIQHRYIGFVRMEEYGRPFDWDAWTYRTPRTKESVVILARYTKTGRLRIIHTSGVLAARIIAVKG